MGGGRTGFGCEAGREGKGTPAKVLFIISYKPH